MAGYDPAMSTLSRHRPWRIEPLGDRCVVVEFEQKVDAAVNRQARSLAHALTLQPPPGVLDVAPAFCSVAVFYRPEAYAPQPSPFQQLKARIAALLAAGIADDEVPARAVRIPVCYGGEHGPDLAEVARACGMTTDEVISAHVASDHVVFMLGFSPGFPYIGGLDPALSVPRRATPRTRIPAGTVAIARDQTAIYSLETPGGWNLIGRTPLRLFDPKGEPPCRLQPGDRIQLAAIPSGDFESEAKASTSWTGV
jgi:inhibitor of KinA